MVDPRAPVQRSRRSGMRRARPAAGTRAARAPAAGGVLRRRRLRAGRRARAAGRCGGRAGREPGRPMIVWLNPATGLSGDMLLGALLDLGAPAEQVRAAVAA